MSKYKIEENIKCMYFSILFWGYLMTLFSIFIIFYFNIGIKEAIASFILGILVALPVYLSISYIPDNIYIDREFKEEKKHKDI